MIPSAFFVDAESIEQFTTAKDKLQSEIDECEKKLKELLRKQLEEDDFTKYEPEFKNIKLQISSKKLKMKDIEKTAMDAYRDSSTAVKIDVFLKKDCLSPSLFKKLTNLIIYKKDGSLRFVLGEFQGKMTRETCDELMTKKALWSSSVTKDGRTLAFDVIKGGWKHGN